MVLLPTVMKVSMDDVVRGKTQLTCLYCGGSLTATSNSYSVKKEVKPDQVKGAIACLIL
jgi:hypothetical protein